MMPRAAPRPKVAEPVVPTINPRRLLPVSTRKLQCQLKKDDPDLRKLVGLMTMHEKFERKVFVDHRPKRRLSRVYQEASETLIEEFQDLRTYVRDSQSKPKPENRPVARKVSTTSLRGQGKITCLKIEDHSFASNHNSKDKIYTLFIEDSGQYTASIRLSPADEKQKAKAAQPQKSQHSWVKSRSSSPAPSVSRTPEKKAEPVPTKEKATQKFKAVVRLSLKPRSK